MVVSVTRESTLMFSYIGGVSSEECPPKYLWNLKLLIVSPLAQDFVNRRKQMHYITEETSLFYGLEMLNILESIHDCGIIHGDIKPDNFVLLQDTE